MQKNCANKYLNRFNEASIAFSALTMIIPIYAYIVLFEACLLYAYAVHFAICMRGVYAVQVTGSPVNPFVWCGCVPFLRKEHYLVFLYENFEAVCSNFLLHHIFYVLPSMISSIRVNCIKLYFKNALHARIVTLSLLTHSPK